MLYIIAITFNKQNVPNVFVFLFHNFISIMLTGRFLKYGGKFNGADF